MRPQRLDEVTRLVQTALPSAAVAVRPSSVCEASGVTYAIASADDEDLLAVLGVDGAARDLEVERSVRTAGITVSICRLTHGNAEAVRTALPFTSPRPLGRMDATVGLGDRLGCAGAGHLAAIRRYRAWPVLAQQSVRELTLTGRTFPEVLDASTWAVLAAGFREPWGADGDHLKTEEQVKMALSAGLTMITADVSEHLHREAASMSEAEVLSAWEGLDPAYRREVERRYLTSAFPLVSGGAVRFTDAELRRIVLLYRDSLELAGRLYRAAVGARGEDGFDFELSIDETDTPTTAQAHLFMGLESQRIGISLSSLAPRFVGEFQKAVDYIGAIREFEQSFVVHAEIAATLGYRISVHSGSDKFSVFPAIGRLSRGRFHIKTAGTSWLEALRVAAARDPSLFRDLYATALAGYGRARVLYHVTPNLAALPAPAEVTDGSAPALLDDVDARRVLHITYGEILAVPGLKSRLFRLLRANEDGYQAMLEKHIGRHLELLGIQLRR
jgi:tagaturonate epimerase